MSDRANQAWKAFDDSTGNASGIILSNEAGQLIRRIFSDGEKKSSRVWDSKAEGAKMMAAVEDLGALASAAYSRLGSPLSSQVVAGLYGAMRAMSAQRIGIPGPSSPACPEIPPPPDPDSPGG